MVELNEIDRFTNERPGATRTTREPARLSTENPIEYLVVLEEETNNGETRPVDYHYHFEDEGDVARLVESYKLVGDGTGDGCTKQQLDGTIENEQAIQLIKQHWSGRWDKVLDGNGTVIIETSSDY